LHLIDFGNLILSTILIQNMAIIDGRGLVNDGGQDLTVAGNVVVAGSVTITGQVTMPASANLSAPNWYISFLIGNDTATGTSLATPLKTFAELVRRWGNNPVFTSNVDITIIDHNISDVITLQASFDSGVVSIHPLYPLVIASSGTMTNYTAENPATNTAPLVQDGAIAWTLGARIKDTSTHAGFASWVAKDEGSGVCDLITTPVNGTGAPGAFAGGDTYIVETLPNLYIGAITFGGNRQNNAGLTYLQITDFNLLSGTQAVTAFAGVGFARFFNCRINCPQFHNEFNNIVFFNCLFFNSKAFFQNAIVAVVGGGAMGTGTTQFVECNQHAVVTISVSFGLRNCPLIIGDGSVVCIGDTQTLNAFDCVVSAAAGNPIGAGVRVGCLAASGGGFSGANGQLISVSSAKFYGQGNAGPGLHVDTNSSMMYGIIPTITGAGGDFVLGNLASDTNGITYDPVTFAQSPPITNTWSHVTASINTGGFGGYAINPLKNARISIGS
jgi:hypothetical protein